MKLWTAAEDDFIAATPHLRTAEVAERLGRTSSAVACRRMKIGQERGMTFRVNNSPTKVGRRTLLAKTCRSCGLFLESSRFGLNNGKWRSRCVHCRAFEGGMKRPDRPRGEGSAARANERLQALSLPHAVNHRKPWTQADHRILSDPDLMVIEKAIRLGRTYMATSSACSSNGYSSRVFQGDPTRNQWLITFSSTKETS